VRALLGSLAAMLLAAVAVRLQVVRTTRARRWVVLVPLFTAALAAVATVRDPGALSGTYLPQLSVTVPDGAGAYVLDMLGEVRFVSTDQGVDLLLVVWLVLAGGLLSRRAAGLRTVRRLLRMSTAVAAGSELHQLVERVRARMGARAVRVRVLDRCPGGAFATGLFRPVVVFDPVLLSSLDEREAEGLVAHELAHVVRRDPVLATLVGMVADLAFFVPTLGVAARWLGREQEHSADELASASTRRPGALASSILKVSKRSVIPHPCGTCAAVSRPALAGIPWIGGPRLSDAARVVAARVERLVEPPTVTRARRVAEAALVSLLFAVGTGATLAIPDWIARSLDVPAVALTYLPSAASPVESPAFTTFKVLTQEINVYADAAQRSNVPEPRPTASVASRCPCLETQAQLGTGIAAVDVGDDRMSWGTGTNPWTKTGEHYSARPLWTIHSSANVGFFVYGPEQI
jgi:beta-lactamase regulating signal transducer with metallopeptidase domain